MFNQPAPSSTGNCILGFLAAGFLWLVAATAANATLSQSPLFLTQAVEPQVMLAMSNDHQLFFEAYPDYLDLDNDGKADQGYSHPNDYFGYFDSYKCYDYNTSTNRFEPAGISSDKYCAVDDEGNGTNVSGDWSGNFLNYLSMSRMDVVRKILFGGFRQTDTESLTVLERAYVPSDAHSWVRYYNGSDLNRLTPFAKPNEMVATSDSNLTVGTGNQSIRINTNQAEFFNTVERGDQVVVYQAATVLSNRPDPGEPGSTPFMLGAITGFNSTANQINVDVQGVNQAGTSSAEWVVANLSRSGVTFCNTTNNAHLNDGERVPASKPPRLSVASGNYSLWRANERWQCRWDTEKSAVNGNNIGITEFAANDRNPDRSEVGLGEIDYNVRVEVCNSSLIGTERCKQYPSGNHKPVGLLQQYGDNEEILFGLLSGSYERNKSGGVLRKNVSGFSDELNVGTDGTFLDSAPATGSIVDTLNVLRMYGYNASGVYRGDAEDCNFQLASFPDGRCVGWGNPQSEIFLEAIRYFVADAPTSDFTFEGNDQLDGLEVQPWTETLDNDNYCAPLNVINFNGSVASYDRDQLDTVSDLPGITDVADLRSVVDRVGTDEGLNGNDWFIGELAGSANPNQLCTSKTLGSLANAVGLCPEGPRLEGGYDAVGLAHHAYTEDMRADLTGDQNIRTLAVALAPAVPRIDIPLPDTSQRAVTILPACRNGSIGGNCALVDFKVVRQDLVNGTGKFLVNWEDSEQGGDYDQDMWGVIDYKITKDTLTVTTQVGAESTSGRLGFGYVLSGTTQDGFHAHSGIEGFSYTDPSGVIGCTNCQVNDAETTVTYNLSDGSVSDGLLQPPMFYAAKWGGYDKQADFPNDAASWDADGDGLPDNYYFAIDPSKLATDLEEVFADILRTSSSAASVAASSSSLSTDTAVYQGSFNSENWSGDLRAFAIAADGGVAETFSWSAAAVLDNLTSAEIDTRKIFTNDAMTAQDTGELVSSTGKEFKWTELSTDQKAFLQKDSDDANASPSIGKQRVDYLRGDRSREQTLTNTSGIFRERDSRLGDIINSNPQFVAQQNFGYANLRNVSAFSTVTDYNTFRASDAYKNRPPLVIVGGNDGMLHGFNASSGEDGGKELFAYVPSDIIPNLSALTELDYSHRYYVDGTPRVADAWLGTSLGWRTIAVGTTGAGGRSIFALDVTDPANMSANDVLWEFSHPDLGRTLQQPSVVPMPNGEFAVVVSSGFSDTAQAGGGTVWLLDVATGRPFRTFELPDTSGQLGSPLAVDLDNDRIVDRIYVGDSEGQLWRIDTEGTNDSQWGIPNELKSGNDLLPLFTAPSGQPITASLSSAFNQEGQHMVFFGTGSFIRQGDNVVAADPVVQAFYGIIDDEDTPLSLTTSDLLKQEIVARVEQIEVPGEEEGTKEIINIGLTAVSNNQITTESGWYLDLEWKTALGGPGPKGERVTSRALVRGDRVIFTSLIPSADACSGGGTGWLYELDTQSGGRLSYAVFDINNDGNFDANDFITVVINGDEEIRVPPSGFNPDIGIINTPTVLTDPESGNERKIFTGSSGQIISVPEAGSINRGRQNWEQIR